MLEVEKLRKSVFDGPCHSVLGDRMKTMGKPYREVVVYDKDRIRERANSGLPTFKVTLS